MTYVEFTLQHTLIFVILLVVVVVVVELIYSGESIEESTRYALSTYNRILPAKCIGTHHVPDVSGCISSMTFDKILFYLSNPMLRCGDSGPGQWEA